LAADRAFVLDLPIRERWQVVEVLRTTVFQCLAVVFDAEPFAEVASMVVGELVENALKYGDWTGGALAEAGARVRISGSAAAVKIEVHNPLPEGASTQLLFAVLERIRASPSLQDAYVERLREVARDPAASGGLGLLRIAYEANCQLAASVDGRRLSMTAQLAGPGENAAARSAGTGAG
jgi:hypothetical protein